MTRFNSSALVVLLLSFLFAINPSAMAQFETRTSLDTGKFPPNSLSLGDFNRDGKLDIAAVSYTFGGKVTIFLGNGDGTFRPGASYSVAVQPFFASAASLRGNGILDLVVGDSLSEDVYVMLGNGDGTFQPAAAYPTTGRPNRVGVGDFTGDGKLDVIALTGIGCGCVEVLPGNGDGTFRGSVVTPISDISTTAMTTAYFNDDEKLDVAVAGAFGSASQVDILLGNGDGSFTPSADYPVAMGPGSVAAGRINGGGEATGLAVADEEGNDISILVGNGNGTFHQPVDYGTWSPAWVAFGDLNGDGNDDMVVANAGSRGKTFASSLTVFIGNGDGTFQLGIAYPAGRLLRYVALGDLNSDHLPDLVAVDLSLGSVITLLNTGVASFSPTTPLIFGTQFVGTTTSPLTATLTNEGAGPLIISSVSFAGKAFQAQTTCKGSIAPGGNCSFTATFTPVTQGASTGMFTIHDSASSKPQFLALVGTGTIVKLTPQSLTFAPQKLGSLSTPQNIQVTNTGGTTLTFTGPIGISIEDQKNFLTSDDCKKSLAAGASCTIQVTFWPQKKGLIQRTVVIPDTGGGGTQEVPVSGTGISP